MSQLWRKHAQDEWTADPLADDLVLLTVRTPIAISGEALGAVTAPVLARSASLHGVDRWTLLCPPGARVRVNGALVTTGIRALADRDAISLPGESDRHTVFLTLERAPEIVPFPGGDDETCCIRCKLPLAPDTPSVRCPGRDCGFWHHESTEQPCWSYTDGCAGCGHPTAFDAGFLWSPDAL